MFTVSEFPNGMTGDEVLVKLNLIHSPIITKLKEDYGLTFSAFSEGKSSAFAWLNSDGEAVGDIHLENRTVQGAEGKMELEFLKTAVLWGASQVLSLVEGNLTPLPDSIVGVTSNLSKEKVENVKKLAKGILAKQKAEKQLFTSTDTGDYDMPPFFPTDTLKTAKTVKLSEATHMYQPVQGTSKNSRYFVVGISSEIKVAARLKGNAVSIRLEGPALSKASFKTALEVAGINGGTNGVYASMHIDTPDTVTATKAVGSVLSALPVEWQTPMPSVGHLQGLGS